MSRELSTLLLIYPFDTLLLIGGGRAVGHLPSAAARASVLAVVAVANLTALEVVDYGWRPLAFSVFALCLASFGFRAGDTAALGRALGPHRFALYLTSVFTIATLVYIHLPITTFFSANDEIGMQLGPLLKSSAKAVVTCLYAATFAYGLGSSPRVRSILAAIALLSVPIALIYAFFYPFGYPQMNGFIFEQIALSPTALALRALTDVATVTVIAVVTLLALLRIGGRRVLAALALVNASLTVASIVRVERDVDELVDPARVAAAGSRQPIAFGKGRDNVLIIFLDRFMGGFMEPILASEPSLATDLEGFTWYPRTISAGQNTIAGLPPLLGGYDYMPREMNARAQAIRDTSVEAFAILPYNFTKKGYAANLVNPYSLGFTWEGDCNFLDIPGLSCSHTSSAVTKSAAQQYGIPLADLAKTDYVDLLATLGSMRIAPYSLRDVISKRGLTAAFGSQSAAMTFKEWAKLKALPEQSRTDSDRGNLNIFFDLLPHEPVFMGEDCLPKRVALAPTPQNEGLAGQTDIFGVQHYTAARCTILVIADYLRWMKAEGVYDSTKIVIVSDHGIEGPVEDRSSRAVAGGTTDNEYVRSRSLLLVKPRNAHGGLRTSEEFMPNAEVPRIVCEEIGGCVNPYLGNKPIEARGRELPFFITNVPPQFSRQGRNRLEVLSEWKLTAGDPYDRRNWHGADE